MNVVRVLGLCVLFELPHIACAVKQHSQSHDVFVSIECLLGFQGGNHVLGINHLGGRA